MIWFVGFSVADAKTERKRSKAELIAIFIVDLLGVADGISVLVIRMSSERMK